MHSLGAKRQVPKTMKHKSLAHVTQARLSGQTQLKKYQARLFFSRKAQNLYEAFA